MEMEFSSVTGAHSKYEQLPEHRQDLAELTPAIALSKISETPAGQQPGAGVVDIYQPVWIISISIF